MRIFSVLMRGTWVVLIACGSALAWSQSIDKSASNLMVVLRESEGANSPGETLVPLGKVKAKLPDGAEVELEPAWYQYLGDMHLRFVFDAPSSMPGASVKDLEHLGLSPQAALDLAVANIKRVYGEPRATPWSGLMQVQGKSPDLDSSYFLDRAFWRGLLKQHPEGVVALVAKRGGLLYTPVSDAKGVEAMRKSVGYLYSSSGNLRVSSALYLFKDDRWSVFQPPRKQ